VDLSLGRSDTQIEVQSTKRADGAAAIQAEGGTVAQKECTKCHAVKASFEFYRDSNCSDGLKVRIEGFGPSSRLCSVFPNRDPTSECACFSIYESSRTRLPCMYVCYFGY